MANKPTEKPAWVSGDEAARIQEPTGSKKLTGFLKNERPPFNFLNWLFNIFSHWLNYFSGNSQYNVIIDSDTDEGDYTSVAAYIADSPAAGDRVLVKVDEPLTATLSIPAGVEITQLKGKKFTLTTNFSPIIQFGDNVKTKGDFRVENSDTGTISRAFSINGDNNHHDNLIIENKSTGTITSGIRIESGVEGNYAMCRVITTAGTISFELNDSSGNQENYIVVITDIGVELAGGAQHSHLNEGTGGPIDFSGNEHVHNTGSSGGGRLVPAYQQEVKTSNYTVTQSDYIILVDASGGAVTITFPDLGGFLGKSFLIKLIDTLTGSDVTLVTTGSDKFDGISTSVKISGVNDYIEVMGDALATWWILKRSGNPPLTKSGTYTANLLDEVLLCDASGGAFTVTLPSAFTCAGKKFIIKKIDGSANAVTVDGSGIETIDGSLTQVLSSQWDVIEIVCNGADWFII